MAIYLALPFFSFARASSGVRLVGAILALAVDINDRAARLATVIAGAVPAIKLRRLVWFQA